MIIHDTKEEVSHPLPYLGTSLNLVTLYFCPSCRFFGIPHPTPKKEKQLPGAMMTGSTRLPGWKHLWTQRGINPPRWAPTNYKWSYKPYKWPYKWVTGVITLLIGVITPLITGRGPTLSGKLTLAGWKIPMFNRKYIFNPGPFCIAMLVYWSVLGGFYWVIHFPDTQCIKINYPPWNKHST